MMTPIQFGGTQPGRRAMRREIKARITSAESVLQHAHEQRTEHLSSNAVGLAEDSYEAVKIWDERLSERDQAIQDAAKRVEQLKEAKKKTSLLTWLFSPEARELTEKDYQYPAEIEVLKKAGLQQEAPDVPGWTIKKKLKNILAQQYPGWTPDMEPSPADLIAAFRGREDKRELFERFQRLNASQPLDSQQVRNDYLTLLNAANVQTLEAINKIVQTVPNSLHSLAEFTRRSPQYQSGLNPFIQFTQALLKTEDPVEVSAILQKVASTESHTCPPNELSDLYKILKSGTASPLENLNIILGKMDEKSYTQLRQTVRHSMTGDIGQFMANVLQYASANSPEQLKPYLDTLAKLEYEGPERVGIAANLLSQVPGEKMVVAAEAVNLLLEDRSTTHYSPALFGDTLKLLLAHYGEKLDKQDARQLLSLINKSDKKEARQFTPTVLQYANTHEPAQVKAYLSALDRLQKTFYSSQTRFNIAADLLSEVPDDRLTMTAKAVSTMIQGKGASQFMYGFSPDLFRENLKLLFNVYNPDEFVSHYLSNNGIISPNAVDIVSRFAAQDAKQLESRPDFQLLPELMTIVEPFAQAMQSQSLDEETRYNYMENLLKAISSQDSGYSQSRIRPSEALDFNQPHMYSNFSRVGSLGLGFIRWKLDAMTRWKGQGPMEKPALMEASGLFQKVPPRGDDPKYNGGFVHYNPATGVSVEMRRAYIVISKRDVGSLVIRNSSNLFGRDKLPLPAYFSDDPAAVYDSGHLFNPSADMHLFRPLTTTSDASTKKSSRHGVPESSKNQGFLNKEAFKKAAKLFKSEATSQQDKIHELLNSFDEVTGQYVRWKNGFKNGKPSEGFEEMLEASLMSARFDGAKSPFAQVFGNIDLSWVNRFGLPAIDRKIESGDPTSQQEMEYYDDMLHGDVTVKNSREYQQNMPGLLTFIKRGLTTQGLELILTDNQKQKK